MVELIAERVIFGSMNGAEVQVTVRVFRPQQSAQDDWSCPFTFEGSSSAPKLKNGAGRGTDSVQALTQALTGIGSVLDQSGVEWFAFPAEEDREGAHLPRLDDGFPRPGLDPGILGAPFRRRMEAYVTREKDAELEALNEAKRRSLERLRER